MYQSTDRLVSNEQGATPSGYQTVESGIPPASDKVPSPPQTFLSQVKQAREDNVSCCSFCVAFFALLLGSIVWTLVLIVIVTVPIVMIVIGAEYFNSCPAQKMIPISLIVGGCVALLSNVLNFVDRYHRFRESSMPKRYTVVGWINVFINLFLAAWFIASCYWVYSVHISGNEAERNYCHPHLYAFEYWLLNFVFIFFGTMVVVSLILMCVALMLW